jgi:uncharacterized protein YqhQ
MTLPKGYKNKKTSSSSSSGGAGLLIGIVVFIIGLILLLHSLITEWTTPFLEQDIGALSTEKIIGIILMIMPIAVGLGLTNGTGRPHGGKRYKGMGGY